MGIKQSFCNSPARSCWTRGVFVAIILLVMASFVFSAPLSIYYPRQDFYMQNSSIQFHIQVYNSTGGLVTPFSECGFNLYNSSNHHVLEVSNVSSDVNGIDKWVNITPSMVEKRGVYPYVIWCNSSLQETGVVSSSFEITEDGTEPKTAGATQAIIMLLPMLFGFILLLGVIFLGEEHIILKDAIVLLQPVCFWATLNLAIINVNSFFFNSILEDNLSFIAFWSGILGVLIFCYYIVYVIWKIMAWKNFKKGSQDG